MLKKFAIANLALLNLMWASIAVNAWTHGAALALACGLVSTGVCFNGGGTLTSDADFTFTHGSSTVLFTIQGDAGNNSGGDPYIAQINKSDGTFILGVGTLWTVRKSATTEDENATYPSAHIIENTENAGFDHVAGAFVDGTRHGAHNVELSGDITNTSGSSSYAWFGNDLSSGFAPSSGTGIFNGLWVNWIINQTGGANGITRGLYINPTLTAVADFRGVEVANVGTTQTAIKTGTGNVALGGPIVNTGIPTTCSGHATGTLWNNSGVVNVC